MMIIIKLQVDSKFVTVKKYTAEKKICNTLFFILNVKKAKSL